MPTLNTHPFCRMPKNLQHSVMTVLEAGTSFAKLRMSDSFSNNEQSVVFAQKMNCEMGFPNSKNLFEFVDIVVSRNTILLKHIDFKNDHRKGYNICVVYSFHQIVDELDYRVSVIIPPGPLLEQH